MSLGGDDDAAIANRDSSAHESAEDIQKKPIIRVELDKVGLVGVRRTDGGRAARSFQAGERWALHVQFHISVMGGNTHSVGVS